MTTEPRERLSDDDQAAAIGELLLQAALRTHALSAPASAVPGTCANCAERCLPSAVYCDAACRDDHERRLRAAAAGGRA